MRVALFFDGKNFYSGLKETAPDQMIDFQKMSRWLVERVGGSHLWGAYYYTGIEPGLMSEGQKKLSGFLDMLEFQPGFFVKRFPRKVHNYACSACGAENRFSSEKEIDTTMVADMLRLAAVDAFDILVLMSGDADHAPAVEGVRAIGKQVFVATWGKTGLSSRIRKASFDHIDLLGGIDRFNREPPFNNGRHYHDRDDTKIIDDQLDDDETYYADEEAAGNFIESDEELPDNIGDIFIEELERAERNFQSGYVGMNYFLKRWHSDNLRIDPERRRLLMDQLIEDERLEVYSAPDGNKAIRVKQ